MRCTAGAIFDVAVDLRRRSATSPPLVRRRAVGGNRLALYVPEGCAHGFLTLTDGAEVAYQISARHTPTRPRGALGRSRVRDRLARTRRGRQRARPQLSRTSILTRTAVTLASGSGKPDARARDGALPALPQHHGRRRSRDAARIGERIPLEVHEVPSGTRCSTGRCRTSGTSATRTSLAPDGRRVVDFRDSNLHVVSYSEPVRATMDLDELRPHLHTHPTTPDWIPYRTSYYNATWGFCLAASSSTPSQDGDVRGRDRQHARPGSLTYGECSCRGGPEDEVLLTTHVCHPSLANDNLSGHRRTDGARGRRSPTAPRRLTYRFLFIPGTIGSITWLAGNEDAASRIMAGLVDRVRRRPGAAHVQAEPAWRRARRPRGCVMSCRTKAGAMLDFVPGAGTSGSTTRRDSTCPSVSDALAEGEFPEYHTSADDLELIDAGAARGHCAGGARDPRRPRARRTLPEPLAEGRAAARQARSVRGVGGRRLQHGAARAALGAQPVRRD